MAALASLGWPGCATTATRGPRASEDEFKNQFPSREVLAKIATAPPPPSLARADRVEGPGWEMVGPLPDAIDRVSYSDGSPWQALLEATADQRRGLVTLPESMHCVAKQTGLFYLAHHGLPDDRLAQFIAARCGALAPDVLTGWVEFELPADAPPARLFAEARPQLEGHLAKLLEPGGPRQAGIWYGRDQKRAVFIVAGSSRRALLEHTPLVPAVDGSVEVRGEMMEPTEHVEAIINRGDFSFARCAVDSSVALPRFAVRCQTEAQDGPAWLEVAAFAPGRVLGHVAARLMVWPGGAPATSYRPPAYVHGAVPAGADPRAQLLALLNEARRRAQLPAVTLAAHESDVAAQVAPHYFAAVLGREPELVADQVVLGLRAGWDVEGEVRRGEFTYGLVDKSDDLGHLLDTVLERPAGREALLSRDVAQVALGPLLTPDHVLGLVAASYQMMHASDRAADAHEAMQRLLAARGAAHQSVPPLITDLVKAADEAAAQVQRHERTPVAALDALLQASAERVRGLMFKGWVLTAPSVEELRFPPELVHQALSGVAISVGHYRGKGAPWSQLVVFVIAVAPENGAGISAARDVTRW